MIDPVLQSFWEWATRSFEPVIVLALSTTAILIWTGHRGFWVFGREHAALIHTLTNQLAEACKREAEWKELALSGHALNRQFGAQLPAINRSISQVNGGGKE